jgi:hypothetical protein
LPFRSQILFELRKNTGPNESFRMQSFSHQFFRTGDRRLRRKEGLLQSLTLTGIVLLLSNLTSPAYANAGAITPFLSYEAEAGVIGGGAALV